MNKILIVVDIQKGFMNHKDYKELSDKVEKYIQSSKYDLIIFTKFINQKNSMYERKLNWTNMQDNSSQELTITTNKKHIVIEKYGYGLDKGGLEYIKSLDVDSVDICGLQTDACVYAISLQLWDCDIFPNVLINYTATHPKKKEAAKQMLIHQFGKVDERK